MNADQFYREILSLKPSVSDFVNDSIEYAKWYIEQLKIVPMEKPYKAMPNDPVLDLIGRYDVSSLCIQIFEFFYPEGVGITDDFIYFGNKEASLLAIEKATGQIAEMDPDEEFIICYMAKDQSSFLDFLVELEKLNQQILFHGMTEDEKEVELQKLLPMLGGDKYAHGIEDL
jgi:hypothetical protein